MSNRLLTKFILVGTFGILLPLLISLFFIRDLFFSIILGALTVVLSSFLFWLFLKPLKDLINSTDSLGRGNFNHRIDIRSGDEFEEVGKSFNEMADKIAQVFQTTEKERDIAVAERGKFNEVLSSIIDGIIALDFNKNVAFANKTAEQLTGFTISELQGQPVDKLIHLYTDQEEIQSKTYCQENFKRPVNLIGKNGKQTKVNLMSTKANGTVQSNLSCILALHDLSREEELERMKLDFVSMASHELKTPLTSIIGYLSVFNEENKGKLPKEEMELVDRSLISAQQLLALVQNLLNVDKVERDQMSVSPEPVDYLPILSKAVDDLKNQSSQKNIVLNLNLPSQGIPKVMADPIRTSEVLTNLISNAINYTNPGGKIEVSAALSPNEVTTVVSDNGVGIPKEALSHLFSKFFRVSNSSQKMSKGTGLGLYITKSIIEKLNGKIWVESELGKGSKFYFTLPLISLSSHILDSSQFVGREIQSGALNY